MPPKTPVVNATSPKEILPAAADEPAPKKKPKAAEKAKPDVENAADAAAARKTPAHPSTMEMVKEAIKALDSRKGSSAQAIRVYILEHYPSVDAARLKPMLRKALVKGLEGGTLVRPPKSSSSATGAQGSFRLPAKNKLKDPKSMENSDPNVTKAPKTNKAPVKAKGKGSDKPKPTAKKAKDSEDLASPEDSGSKVAPAKKPKVKKPAGETGQKDKVLKPVQTQSSEAGKDATAGKKAVKRGKTAK